MRHVKELTLVLGARGGLTETRRWRRRDVIRSLALDGGAMRRLILPIVLTALVLGGLVAVRAQAPAQQSTSRSEKTAWYFYRVKWGFQDEFVSLFKKNHYPVLREEMKTGRITAVRTFVPTYHGDGRADWTFAVAITFRDAAAMMGPSGEAEIVKKLYPDQATFQKEERRRFEILDAHWDVPLNEVDMERN
jgi:hypothetical protein